MKLFAFGHQRPGQPQDIIIEVNGVRKNLTLAARVTAEKHHQKVAAEERANFAAVSKPEGRDRNEYGDLDFLEQSRV